MSTFVQKPGLEKEGQKTTTTQVFDQEKREVSFSKKIDQEYFDEKFKEIFNNQNWKKRNHFIEKELNYFSELIEYKIQKNKDEIIFHESLLINPNGTDDTSPTFKAFEEGSEVSSKESNTKKIIDLENLNIKLKNAFIRVQNKTFGVCFVTKKLQNPARLNLVPHATLSVEAKDKRT